MRGATWLLTGAVGVVMAMAPAAAQTVAGNLGSDAVHPAEWPSPKWPYARDAATEAKIAALLKRMSVEEKVGQVIQPDIASVTPADMRKYHFGSILNGGNSAPNNDEFAPAGEWLKLADAFYDASVDATGGKVAVPMIWGTDAVHGHSNIVGATLFPHNIGLGAMRDSTLIEKIGAATAAEIRATGMEWTFAPTVTVPQDYRWGRAYEGYSSDPTLVAGYVGAMIRGLQGAPNGEAVLKGAHVIASTKHFLADGGTAGGVDQGDAKIDEATLRRIHGAPYVPAIENGVDTVMASFSSWNGRKLTGHKGLLTDVLKNRMNFGGFIVSDWNAHGQVEGCTNARCPTALLAGIDLYMAPDSWKPVYESLLAEVKAGTVPMARLDDAVARILRVKYRMGLFEAGRPSSRPLAGQFDLLGSPAHRAVAREAVAKSLVLLKQQGSVLPIRPGAKVLVAGDGADDIGRQSGGWTLTWQGTGVDNSRFPGATSIWKGLNDAVTAAGGTATLAPDGHFTTKPDVAIVVFGETPYAEFQGDVKALQLRPELRQPWETMRKLKAAGVPVVALMITGRPLYVNPALNVADAFVVTWLPGSEGGGIADVLVAGKDGRAKRGFTGKLPTAWPISAAPGAATLFPFGYGMAGAAAWKPLPENSGVAEATGEGVYLDRGVPSPAWSLEVGAPGQSTSRISTVPAQAAAGKITVTATDNVVQEGARKFAVTGGQGVIALSTQDPVDVTRQSNGDVALIVTARRDAAVTGTPTIGVRNGQKTASVPFGDLAALPAGQWRTISVPLKCFAKAGADLAKLDAPFVLTLPGPATVSISRVALGTVADQIVACPK
ncbi:glycoside hydrolase family 3 N-terminal domain-containing protein [Sphingomonas sp. 1P08PE]|uniref:glycoside hydrolase family 3 protein n=1 Tax=Sphingomonas sp. 1P08PE TaxID=554122 RepID=UPI00399F42B9